MKLRALLAVYAVLIAVGGLVSLFVPAPYMSLYGVTDPDTAAIVLLRVVGATGIGLAAMAWYARNADASTARDALVLGLTVMNALTAIVLFTGAWSGGFNALAWVPAALYALFTVLLAIAGRASMAPKSAAGAGG